MHKVNEVKETIEVSLIKDYPFRIPFCITAPFIYSLDILEGLIRRDAINTLTACKVTGDVRIDSITRSESCYQCVYVILPIKVGQK